MKLIQIYECLCDETRLRILNLLSVTPLCVSHLQKVLDISQVKVSKHLTYLKEREMVVAMRIENWMLYSIAKDGCAELESNLKCLKACSADYPIFEVDLGRLDLVRNEVKEIQIKMCQLTDAKRG